MIEYRVTDGTGLSIKASIPRFITAKLMNQIGNGVRATIVKMTSEGVDYNGRAFRRYSTRRLYVPLDHMPKPKGGRRVRLSSLKGTFTAERIVMADMTRGPMKRPRGTKGTEKKKGTKLKSVAYDHGYLQYRSCMGRGARVDLEFTGRMLAAFQIVQCNNSLVRLGFVSKQEAAKALGNITGRRGKSSRAVNPRRFVGIGSAHEKTIHTILEEHIKQRLLIADPNMVLVKRIA